MKKVISLLLALVMTLSLCSSALATGIGQEDDKGAQEEEYTMDTLLAEVDKVEGANDEAKAAAKEFLADNFIYDGRFVVLKDISFWDNRFYETNNNKAKAKTVLDSYTAHKAVLENVPVKYGAAYDMTVDSLMNMYRAAQEYPVIQEGMPFPEGGPTTGEVVGVGNLEITEKNKGYIETQDVTDAKNFFNEHFRYVDLGEEYSGDHAVDFKAEFYDSDGKLIGDKVRSVIAEYNNELRAGSVVLLNELNIHMPNRDGTECYHFWRLMDMYRQQLNGGDQGGGDQGGGDHGDDDRPTTGNVTDPEQLNSDAQEFIKAYIDYSYGPTPSGAKVSKLTIKGPNGGATDKNNWYTDPAAREAVIAAYNAFCNIGSDVQNELNKLFVMDDNGNPCTFYSYMLGMRQLADNGSGTYTDTNALNKRLRDAGYIAPVLGRDLLLSFPTELRRGEDYDYTYDQSSGHLTITVKKGSAERWLDAAESSFNDDRVLFNMTLVNTKDKALWQFWNGNNDGGTWEQFVDGTMTLEQEKWSEFGNGDVLAVVNRENDTMSMTSSSDNRNYRVLMIWANEGEEFPNMTKYMYTYEVKVEESFYYERQNVLTVGKVDMSRVILKELPESWTYDEAENGVLKIWYNGALNGGEAGKVTVKASDGYTLRVDESSVPNGDKEQLSGNQNGAVECVLQLRGRERNTFLLTWENKEGKKKKETLDVFFLQNILDTLGNYDVNSNGELITRQDPLRVTKPESTAAPTNKQMTLSYNKEEGFFYTFFDYGVLPSYEQLQEGILLTPDNMDGATHFRQVNQSTGDRPRQEATTAQSLVMGFARMSERETYEIEDPANNQLRTLPYVDTEYQEIGGIQVSYAADQGYRYKIVQWLHKEDNGTYTVLGYSYVWGRNDAFINEIQTPGVADGKEAASEEPFVIGEGMQLRCDRYPQYGGDGKIQYFQFRAYGDHEGDYILYIPYEYFGMDPADGLALRDRGQRPRINHYYEDHTLRETIVGEYTEYGVKFTTKSFSPFVVDCSTQTTPPRYYYNSTTAADSKQEGGNSPTTFDAGIALYVGMALTSAAGMAWVGKKRR